MGVLEGPKEEKSLPADRVKVRSLSDGKVGWITKSEAFCKKWTPVYRVQLPTALQLAKSPAAAEGSTPVREVAKGEMLELLEGPCLEDKVMRIRVSCQKDGATGWATIKGSDGKRYI